LNVRVCTSLQVNIYLQSWSSGGQYEPLPYSRQESLVEPDSTAHASSYSMCTQAPHTWPALPCAQCMCTPCAGLAIWVSCVYTLHRDRAALRWHSLAFTHCRPVCYVIVGIGPPSAELCVISCSEHPTDKAVIRYAYAYALSESQRNSCIYLQSHSM